MAINPMNKVLEHLRRAVTLGDAAGLTDGQLLERYLNHREDAAFAALVRRHGPMVMSVCRRVLGNDHDAEDAFQASFLVLVRKAASVVPRERVANFLYGVAHTTALRAKVLIAKRRAKEKQVKEMPEAEAKARELWDDLRPVLDLELSRLPDKYRVPIVLCDLEGKLIKEAARYLGWPQGTLAGRLARGRVMLAKRLVRRGLAVSGGALAALLSQQASASVSSRVLFSTIEAARLFAAGQAASSLISAPIAALTEGVLKTMLVTKLKTATAVVMVTAALALSAAGGVYQAVAGDKPQAETPRPATRPAAADVQSAKPPANPRLPRQSAPELVSSESSAKNELPTTLMPRQALVRLEKGTLSVETLDIGYEPVTRVAEGRNVTSYLQFEIRKTRRYPIDIVHVYDMKGKRIDAKQLPQLVKKETVALFSSDERAADPLNLQLFKEGTLLFVLSSPMTALPRHTAQPGDPIRPYAPVQAFPTGEPVLPPPAAPSPIPYAPTIRLAPAAPTPSGRPVPPPAANKPKAIPSTVSPEQR